MANLSKKKILLGVGGGIAAYKACEILRRLTDAGADVHVVLTKAAQKFVTPLTFQSLSQNPIHTDLFNLTEESEMSHIKLADGADLMLIAPATADLIAKMACGLADDLLTTSVLVCRSPIFVAPSMNVNMWEKEIVQKNLQILRDRGIQIIEPEEGYLACGWEGKGRLAEVDTIVSTLSKNKVAPLRAGKKKSLAGKKILINAGPTREHLDPIRFLSNPSSGKMGFAIAAEAQRRGAKVTLISGPVQLNTPAGVHRLDVLSAQEMLQACQKHFPKNDIFIGTAAVGDYRFEKPKRHKLKKSNETLKLQLKPSPDILATLSQIKKNGQVLVGFAAETRELLKNAKAKMQRKKLDLIVANQVDAKGKGFGSDQNQVTILTRRGKNVSLPKLSKTETAVRVWDQIENYLTKK